jgi:hypothetical protein
MVRRTKETPMQAQNLIKSWAKENGRKYGWLAEQVPVNPKTVSSWVNGHHIPSAPCRARLSDIIGADVRDVSMWVAA